MYLVPSHAAPATASALRGARLRDMTIRTTPKAGESKITLRRLRYERLAAASCAALASRGARSMAGTRRHGMTWRLMQHGDRKSSCLVDHRYAHTTPPRTLHTHTPSPYHLPPPMHTHTHTHAHHPPTGSLRYHTLFILKTGVTRTAASAHLMALTRTTRDSHSISLRSCGALVRGDTRAYLRRAVAQH